ncbi:hypothetical protein [Burkholderia cepacia]|nr:hypothetical protein [Burkholderia cepacia]
MVRRPSRSSDEALLELPKLAATPPAIRVLDTLAHVDAARGRYEIVNVSD